MLAFLKRPWVMAIVVVGLTLYFREEIIGLLPGSVKRLVKA